jgi:hypothetical protein
MSRWIGFIPPRTADPVVGSTACAELERGPDAAHESFLAERHALCRDVEATDARGTKGRREWFHGTIAAQRKDLGKDIKPTGTVAVVHYADKKGDVARIHVEMTSGKDALSGDIDVDVPLDLAASWPSF